MTPDADRLTAPVVVAEHAPAASVAKPKKVPNAGKVALAALREAIDEVGAVPPASNHIPPHVKTVTLAQWRDYAYRRGVSTSEEPRSRQAASPAELQSPRNFTFSAGVTATAKEPDAGRSLIRHLTQPSVQAMLKNKGMEPATADR